MPPIYAIEFPHVKMRGTKCRLFYTICDLSELKGHSSCHIANHTKETLILKKNNEYFLNPKKDLNSTRKI